MSAGPATDPVRGRQTWSTTYYGNINNYWSVLNFTVVSGVATWTASQTQTNPAVLSKIGVVYVVYDQTRRCWEVGNRTYGDNSPTTGWTIMKKSLKDSDGIVAWVADKNGSMGNTSAEMDYVAYNPKTGTWQSYVRSYPGDLQDIWIVCAPQITQGIVTWYAYQISNILNKAGNQEIGYAAFSPSGSWKTGWYDAMGGYNGRFDSLTAPTVNSSDQVTWTEQYFVCGIGGPKITHIVTL